MDDGNVMSCARQPGLLLDLCSVVTAPVPVEFCFTNLCELQQTLLPSIPEEKRLARRKSLESSVA
jgi:hypothetical protein